ncbi:MAG: cytochrome c [Acidiferrobacterales bacterium]|nr:cytochrome c [Acidiferrobacterales bacterium]
MIDKEKALLVRIFSSLIFLTSFVFTSAIHADEAEKTAYKDHVKCAEGEPCKIDLYLTRGYRAFSQCQVCHGLDATGSSFAPSLTDKMQEIDKALFIDRVENGFKGQIGVMPPWKENPNVMKYIDQLYDYLMARSDGAIPGGKLKRYDR